MSKNPFLDRVAKHGRTSAGFKRAPKQEASLAKRLGGVQTAASGARFHKGDLRVRGIARIEAKTTQAESFRVTRDMIRIIEQAGMGHNEVPAMIIEFLNAAGKPEAEVAVIPVEALKWLIANAKD